MAVNAPMTGSNERAEIPVPKTIGQPSRDYNIAFFTNTYRPFVGGVAMSVELFQRHLAALGDHVTIYAPHFDGEAEPELEAGVQRLPAIRHFNATDFSLPLPVSFKMLQDFQDIPYDIVHVHHPFLLGEVGMYLARQRRLPLVFTYHTQYERYTHYVPIDHEQAARTILRHTREFCDLCDMVIAPTRDIKKSLEERGVQTWIEVLPTGVELERFAASDPTAARRALNIAPDDPLLLHVGRLAAEKNLEYLVRACLVLLRENPRAHFAIAGEGKIQPELEKLARDAGPEIAARVHFAGLMTGQSLANLYSAADLFVFASQTETQGMVVAEAMAAGTPVVALDADGVRDLVENGRNGRLLPSSAGEAAFAHAIDEALNDRAGIAQWRDAARETAANLGMDLQAGRLHELYGKLKMIPNHRLKQETLSFGLIRNYFETVWEDVGKWFERI
ncbi:glycosyltransferase [bacterium]|nr:glycosyltransferase [bacterium]